MSSVNKAIIVGNAGADAEVRYTAEGKAVASFSVATSEKWGEGDRQRESTEWHRIVAWGQLAELCGQYVAKGSKVYVEGKIQTRKWTDKQGAERYSTEIVAKQVVFLSSKNDGGRRDENQGGKAERKPAGKARDARRTFDDDDSIPF